MGTSFTKTVLVDLKGNIRGVEREGYEVYHPKEGYAEQNPDDWWNAITTTTRKIVENLSHDDEIVAISFSAQAAGTLPIDKDGKPLMNCLTWLDTRASGISWKLFGSSLTKYNLLSLMTFLRITGGGPGLAGKDPISKILWIKNNEPDIYRDTYKFLDVKDYLIYKTTGNFITSYDGGNLTWLMDTRKNKMKWSDAILRKYGIDRQKLPVLKPSTDIAGKLLKSSADEMGLDEGIPVVVGASDLSSAAVGSGAVLDRETHANIGTSSWLGAHLEDRKTDVFHYIGSICSANPNKYICIAEQETAGVCYEWIRSNFFPDKDFTELDRIAGESEPGSEGLIFTPWMLGERAPIDDDHVRAGFYNLGLRHGRREILRSILEGVAFNLKWALIYFEKLVGDIEWINFIGGGAKSDLWMQIFADVLNKEVRRVADPQEASAKGAAYIAMVALGYLKKFDDIKKVVRVDRAFRPIKENNEVYEKMFKVFRKIYKKKVSRVY